MAPPPAPPVPRVATSEPRWNPAARAFALIVGGYVAAVLVAVLVADAAGLSVGTILAGLPVPGLGLLLVLYYLARGRAPLPAANAELVSFHNVIWTRRMQVWEHARFCSACRVAFWPAGALKAGFPASPAVPAHEFPLTVATLAETAYGRP
ncbi:hypothetical protein ACFV1L_35625 [Kitasatospora sp. NPDC059646]|uniref:hypothetical protein n=1 Tax=Kitasatospora sp. NPDC059646 TaxID=3346893 RepID=UPI0036CA5A23